MSEPKLQPGSKNLITDISHLTVGNATDEKAQTGVTVLRCTDSFVSAVDIRGGAPGTRETDVLSPENLVGRTDAIVLTGGSVFGLAAADGVTAVLSYDNVGLKLGDKGPAIPIVPAAVLHDLNNDGDKNWGNTPPYRTLGAEAAKAAKVDFNIGAVGAGCGAMAGTLKGGIGSASITLENGVIVGALVAVNPVGSVVMSDGKTFYAWPWELNGEFGGRKPPPSGDSVDPFPAHSRLGWARAGANTTIAIIGVNADLTSVEAKRVAMMAHDGIARAIRPAHTAFDGDIVFSVATAEKELPHEPSPLRHGAVARIGAAGADCLARAIARGVYEAQR
ncbi:P1 family peptidase [Hyphococcus flavus]|uniref:P1 family peptidase n=1 Tax=Hyphococcus flavus TaxID=1866326 RepID=A0AAE9ZI02_9PROT|nr:P1 family peptidase [Hyphococcus flavus]WDI31236.1 P1 family peptidase [Hyphococcus flavus]